MKWMRERDALIAQTLAFVQSVTGRKDGPQPVGETPALPPASVVDVASLLAIGPADTIGQSPRDRAVPPDPQPPFQVLPPRTSGEFRNELLARVANFRKHQERFEREREDYCAATMNRLRAAIRDVQVRPPAEK
ncbi:MAG: hypothetical protein KGM94_23315 [Bradyrhizobium sp.]|nr:hypothetical protein [Bradyrhizobium sp.]MDE2380207.1 hypothetical protein [Bradyrhizobium sp.]